ncbi:MAG: ATP-grasp domain-containing protein, partial [Candidatus Nanopelagicales bacterium]
MDLYEYQAKELFKANQVPTQEGAVVTSAQEAKLAAESFNRATVIKAQVKTGGRGKAGGVKLATNPDEAFSHAQNILGL